MDDQTSPFATYKPSQLASCAMAAARSDISARFRPLRSLLGRLAGNRSAGPIDATVLGDLKARLYPATNLCEKRVLLGTDEWDLDERRLLCAFIERADGDFTFVDIGANAGLYSLFVGRTCQRLNRRYEILCFEPSARMAARLRYNLSANEIDADVSETAILPEVAGCTLQDDKDNIGASRIADRPAFGDTAILGEPIHTALLRHGMDRVTAMKIDIEGGELAALLSFFESGLAHLFPSLLLVETLREDGADITALCQRQGYRVLLRTKMNTVFSRAHDEAVRFHSDFR